MKMSDYLDTPRLTTLDHLGEGGLNEESSLTVDMKDIDSGRFNS
jgi:hypothetical protein